MMAYTGEDVIKHLDDTHWKVYGLNKQMCDIGRLISVEEMAERYNKQILQSRLDGLSAWLKLQDMEEKKTKKMTKAEAFEYLKGKKVYVAGKSGEIQEVLFKAGFSWDGSSASQKIESTNEPFLYIGDEGSLMYGSNVEFFIRDTNEEISADDILSIEIVENTKPDCERNEHVKALQKLITKSGCIDCIIISKNDIGILKK